MDFLFRNHQKKLSTFRDHILNEEKKLVQIKIKINHAISENTIDSKTDRIAMTFNTQDFFPKNTEENKKKPIKILPILLNKRPEDKTKINMVDLIIQKNIPISLDILEDGNKLEIKNYDVKENNFIKGISSYTKQGLVRSRNDDRITVMINVPKPENIFTNKWPFCCFFGIYDGHNGNLCADFLHENLHKLVKIILIFRYFRTKFS